MAPKNLPISKVVRKAPAGAVKTGDKAQRAGMAPTDTDLVKDVVSYRGNVPLKNFFGWVLLVLLGVSAVGLLTAQLLVSQRQNQLIADTAARVELQGQSKARLVGEWLRGLMAVGNTMAGSQFVRLYVHEKLTGNADAGLSGALNAQTPYMQQALSDFVQKNRLESATLFGPQGQLLLQAGMPLEDAQRAFGAGQGAQASGEIGRLMRTREGVVMPLRLGRDAVVMDVALPVLAAGSEQGIRAADANPTDPVDKAVAQQLKAGEPVEGVLWFTLPVGDRLSELLQNNAQDRPGERTALVQQLTDAQDGASATLVNRTALAPMGTAFEDFRQSLASGRALSLSAMDGKATFATLTPVQNTPLHVLQEYRAGDALALMNLYKPGLYLIVMLGIVVLAAFMLAMTVHLMAQRNKTRVKLLGQTMDALVRAVEARDPHLAGHHARVARLAVAVSNRLNLPVGERATLFYAAQLSAVGRLLIPRDVLAKPGKLTPEQRRSLEMEISKAQGVLAGLDFDLPIVPVIGQMYERADGSGFPAGLKGDEISRMARVLGAVDAYVALTADRSYRNALTPSAAQKVLLEGGKFDAEAVAALKGLK